MNKIMVLALVMVLSLAACGGNSNTPNGDNNTTPPPSGTPNQSQVGTPDQSQTRKPDQTSYPPADSNSGNNNSPDVLQGGNINNATPATFAFGRDFSEGVVWVETLDSDRVWHCVDEAGKTLFSLGSYEAPLSDFSHGVAWVARGGDVTELIDKSGSVVSSPDKGDYDKILDFIPELGMIIVTKNVNTFQLTEKQIGVIDSKGAWHLPLQRRDELDSVYDMSNRTYIGDGYIRLHSHLYNILTNELYARADIRWWSLRCFDNGYGVFSDGKNIYSINSSTLMEEIILEGAVYDPYAYSEGLFFSGGMYWDDDNLGEVFYNNGFFDINGNRVIDFSEYVIGDGDYRDITKFIEGYSLLFLKNEQNSHFYTAIDKTGTFMFDPKPYNILYPPELNNGMIVTVSEKNTHPQSQRVSFSDVTIDNINGERVTEFDLLFNRPNFIDGISLIQLEREAYYIDNTGKRLF